MGPISVLALALSSSSMTPPSKMMEVSLKLHLIELPEIRDREQAFDVELYLYLSWRDPSLAHEDERKREVSVEGHWTPNVEFVQARDIKRDSDEKLSIAKDGTVEYVQHFWVTLSTHLDLREFPFDQHVLQISLESFSHATDELTFVDNKGAAASGDFRVVEGWGLDAVTTKVMEHVYPTEDRPYSRFVAELKLHRDADFYLWKIVLPMILIIAMSWSVFWMNPNELEAQMGVAVTSMLAVVAFNFAIADSLPRISYVSRMDVFINFGYIFVFGAFIENLVGHWYVRKDKWATADRIDYWCRFFFPGAYVLQLVVFFLWR